MIEIRNRFTNASIHTVEADTLSYASLSYADLSDANLTYANLRGANLSYADLSSANLYGANLSGADLRGAILANANLANADLSGADLTNADLTNADLLYANLSYANLTNASLSYANLHGANLPAAPIVDTLDRKILDAVAAGGELDMSTWHTCETTHCRAGWAVVIAGKAGKDLEAVVGTAIAGMLIYHASTGRVPNFYTTTEEALRDIKECAG